MNLVNIAGTNMTNKVAKMLTDFDLDILDCFDKMRFEDNEKYGKEYALQIIINTVEGDFTQLIDELAEIAEMQDFDYTNN